MSLDDCVKGRIISRSKEMVLVETPDAKIDLPINRFDFIAKRGQPVMRDGNEIARWTLDMKRVPARRIAGTITYSEKESGTILTHDYMEVYFDARDYVGIHDLPVQDIPVVFSPARNRRGLIAVEIMDEQYAPGVVTFKTEDYIEVKVENFFLHIPLERFGRFAARKGYPVLIGYDFSVDQPVRVFLDTERIPQGPQHGTVIHFDSQHGFIRSEDTEYFFHADKIIDPFLCPKPGIGVIFQVKHYSECLKAVNLRSEYDYGTVLHTDKDSYVVQTDSRKIPIPASDIPDHLDIKNGHPIRFLKTDDGFRVHHDREKFDALSTGFIHHYNPLKQVGIIMANDIPLFFGHDSVIDSRLALSEGEPVKFQIGYNPRGPFAKNIEFHQ